MVFRSDIQGEAASREASPCLVDGSLENKERPPLPVQTAADLTDLAMVHYDEADPNHRGRWQVSLALPGVKLPMVGRLGDLNEGIGRKDALLAGLSGLELLACELGRAPWLFG